MPTQPIKGPPDGPDDAVLEAIQKRIPQADMDKFQKEMQAQYAGKDPLAAIFDPKTMISTTEKTTEFMLKYCKTPEECQAVVRNATVPFAELEKSPDAPADVKKLAKEAGERIKKLAPGGYLASAGGSGVVAFLRREMPSVVGASAGVVLGLLLSKRNRAAGGAVGLLVGGAAGYGYKMLTRKDEKKDALPAAPAAPQALPAAPAAKPAAPSATKK